MKFGAHIELLILLTVASNTIRIVNDVSADKNVVTKIMNNSTGLQSIELIGFSKRHLENWLLPLCIWLVVRPVLRPRLVPVV